MLSYSVSSESTTESNNVDSAAKQSFGIDYEKFLSCVHCGLCTANCPTYKITGDENDSPRGRIYLMRAVVDGKTELTDAIEHHLELCLDCRACETACPSGVQYGRLIEPFRSHTVETKTDWFHRWILWKLFPNAKRLSLALIPARISARLGLFWLIRATGIWKLLPARIGRLLTMLPPLQSTPALPKWLPAVGEKRATVALFTGCVADAMLRQVHWATVRVLQANGCEVLVPEQQACCGAIHFHSGNESPAQELADANLDAFGALDVDAIVVNVAGCGAMLKEYGVAWSDARQPERQAFASRVRDVSEFLAELGWVAPMGELSGKATYHDACHLAHAQGIRSAPRQLLEQIPGIEWIPLAESDTCCGAAGTYNLTQTKMADELGARKLNHILQTGARTVISANAGCTLQIIRESRLRGTKLEVLHPMELLDRSCQRAGSSSDQVGTPSEI